MQYWKLYWKQFENTNMLSGACLPRYRWTDFRSKTRRRVSLGAFTLLKVVYGDLHMCLTTHCNILQHTAILADESALVPLLWWVWYTVIYTYALQHTARHCNKLQKQDSQTSQPRCLYSGASDTLVRLIYSHVHMCFATHCKTRRWVSLGAFTLVIVIWGGYD